MKMKELTGKERQEAIYSSQGQKALVELCLELFKQGKSRGAEIVEREYRLPTYVIFKAVEGEIRKLVQQGEIEEAQKIAKSYELVERPQLCFTGLFQELRKKQETPQLAEQIERLVSEAKYVVKCRGVW